MFSSWQNRNVSMYFLFVIFFSTKSWKFRWILSVFDWDEKPANLSPRSRSWHLTLGSVMKYQRANASVVMNLLNFIIMDSKRWSVIYVFLPRQVSQGLKKQSLISFVDVHTNYMNCCISRELTRYVCTALKPTVKPCFCLLLDADGSRTATTLVYLITLFVLLGALTWFLPHILSLTYCLQALLKGWHDVLLGDYYCEMNCHCQSWSYLSRL